MTHMNKDAAKISLNHRLILVIHCKCLLNLNLQLLLNASRKTAE